MFSKNVQPLLDNIYWLFSKINWCHNSYHEINIVYESFFIKQCPNNCVRFLLAFPKIRFVWQSYAIFFFESYFLKQRVTNFRDKIIVWYFVWISFVMNIFCMNIFCNKNRVLLVSFGIVIFCYWYLLQLWNELFIIRNRTTLTNTLPENKQNNYVNLYKRLHSGILTWS